MTEAAMPDERLIAWTADLREGRLSDDDHARLIETLRRDPDAREAYLELMELDALLEDELLSGQAQTTGSDEPLATLAPARTTGWGWAVAAALLLGGLIGLRLTPVLGPEPLAQVTDQVAARLDDGNRPAPGAALARGPLRVDEGLLELRLRHGVRIVIEGPSELNLQTDRQIQLQCGTITVHVPRGAEGFGVETPAGRVVDLGTAFGLQVDDLGRSEVHVLEGRVQVQSGPQASRTVDARHAARWNGRDIEDVSYRDEGFTSALSRAAVRRIDLLDIVADGDGRGLAHGQGIEPHTGEPTSAWWHDHDAPGTSAYKPVSWHPMIDGVFVPFVGDGPVQLDSAGHRFNGFPKTNEYFVSPIWSLRPKLGSDPDEPMKNWVKEVGDGRRYNPQGRGLLAIHANAGITFDLRAVARANPGWRPRHFRATTGNVLGFLAKPGRARQSADVWVFVDGEERFRKLDITRHDGVFDVNIPLAPGARFLTLVATDTGNAHNNDQIVFGDAVVEMALDRGDANHGGQP